MKTYIIKNILFSGILTATVTCAMSQSTQNILEANKKAPLAEKVQSKKATAAPKPAVAKQTLTFQIIPAEANTFGYDILSDGKRIIHQPSRPGLPGNGGFKKKEQAEKVAKLVIYKLSHNIMPPTIERKELDSLKIQLNY